MAAQSGHCRSGNRRLRPLRRARGRMFADDNYVTKDSRYIVLCDRTDETEFYIKSEVIPDLIKALQKAVELGWTD